jgi:hypothetical protein
MTKHQSVLTNPPALRLWVQAWAIALHDGTYKWANNRQAHLLQKCLGLNTREEFMKVISIIRPVTALSLLQEMRYRKMLSDWTYDQIAPYLIQQEMEKL